MKNQVNITRVRKVKGTKVEVEFAQVVNNTTAVAGNRINARANVGDSRFEAKPRKAWVSGEPEALAGMFPAVAEIIMEISQKELHDATEPEFMVEVESIDGEAINIEVIENVTPDYDGQQPKTAGKDGDVMQYGGEDIFSHTFVVTGEPNHVWLKADPIEMETTASAYVDPMAAAQA